MAKSVIQSPFMFGKTVALHAFTNRDNERKKLRDNLMQGINTVIISPRRWGKSSLVEKVIHEIRENESDVKVASIDLFAASNEQQFLEVFAREVVKATSGQWQEWVSSARKIFRSVMPVISVGKDPYHDFSLSFQWEELKKHRDEILNLPETVALDKDINLIVCMDEFQNLAAYRGYQSLEKSMRACWQRHKRVTYCLYGSKRHMMTDIFNRSSKPFYRFGDIMMLNKIAEDDWVSFITESFAQSGKQIEASLARRIAQTMKNHPWYVQQLAHYVWMRTDKVASEKAFEMAMDELYHSNEPLYQRDVENLSATQVELLRAIAAGEKKLSSKVAMLRFAIGTPHNVLKNKKILINQDIIDVEKDEINFLDPSFEIWFRRVFCAP